MDNQTISEKLRTHARKLAARRDNLYRVNAYRQAAWAVDCLERPVLEILQKQGRQGLENIPGLGAHLSFAVERLATTGQYYALAEGMESIPAEEQVVNLPGVGPHVAQMLFERFGIQTVSELARIVHSRQFEELPLGRKRRRQLTRLMDEIARCKQRESVIRN